MIISFRKKQYDILYEYQRTSKLHLNEMVLIDT